ncbi:MAG: hypothetical protein RLZZ495_664 [Pseudomonadota bacterium]|jgi:hypothetical protein
MPIQLAQLSAFPLNGTARLCRLLLPLALCAVPVSNQAAALNDTGITFCAYVIPSASTATASASAVDTALAKRTSALDALNTAAINVNAAANTAAVSAANAKTVADTALASVNAAKTAATAAGGLTTEGNTTTSAAQAAANSGMTAAAGNASAVSQKTTSNSTAIGAETVNPISIDTTTNPATPGNSPTVFTAPVTTSATEAKKAVSTLTTMTSDITAVNTTKANTVSSNAAAAKSAMSELTIVIAQNLTCTPVAPATTCTPPSTPSDVTKAQGSINTLASTAATTAGLAGAAQPNSASMAVDTSDKAVTAYTDAASIRIVTSQYINAAAVNTQTTAFVSAANTAKTSASDAIPVAQAATAVAKASSDVTALDTAAAKAAVDTNLLVTNINLYNTAVAAYKTADTAYEQAKTDAGTSSSIAADAALCAIVAADTIAGTDPRYATYPRQDGRYGRDAESAANILPKIGGGRAGFDFTKISNSGVTLPAAALHGTNPTDWACTRDNVTGLMWEVKTTTAPRSKDLTYTWADANAYVATINAANLCNGNDWRLPTVKELESIVDFSSDNLVARIDKTYFPNTSPENTWTSNKVANYPSYVWTIYFAEGNTNFKTTNNKYAVRLVRGGK